MNCEKCSTGDPPRGMRRKTSCRKKWLKISWYFPKCSVPLKITLCCLDNHCRLTLCNNSFQCNHIWVIKLAHDRRFLQEIFLVLFIWAVLKAWKNIFISLTEYLLRPIGVKWILTSDGMLKFLCTKVIVHILTLKDRHDFFPFRSLQCSVRKAQAIRWK